MIPADEPVGIVPVKPAFEWLMEDVAVGNAVGNLPADAPASSVATTSAMRPCGISPGGRLCLPHLQRLTRADDEDVEMNGAMLAHGEVRRARRVLVLQGGAP